jgi:AhpD family alkylhydroperoxidase
MSRIKLIDKSQAPLASRGYYAKGDPGPIITSLAHVPELLDTAAPFISMIYGESAVPMRLKEIVVLRTSALLNCRYCTQTHTAVSLDAGLSRDEVLALRADGPADAAFSDPRELALLAWTELLAAGPKPVTDEDAANLHEHFTEPEIVELTMLAGVTLMLNRYCTSLNLPTSAGTLARLEREDLL